MTAYARARFFASRQAKPVAARLTGWRFVLVWCALLIGSWALVLGMPYALLKLAQWVLR